MNIGFIGTGRMGAPMASNLIKAGHKLTVHDANPEATARLVTELGATYAGTPAEVCAGADFVFTSLPGPTDVESVVMRPDGVLAGLEGSAVYIDLSTNAPSMVRKLHKTFADKGFAMMDAPVSGGEEGAIAGTLTVMVGGDKAVFDRAEPVLKGLGRTIYYCGGIGNGSVTKLANNLSSVINGIGLGEVLTMGVKAGVDLKVLAEVIGASTGASQRLVRKFPIYLFKGNFKPGFAAALSAKDTRLALELGEEMGVPMAAGALARQTLEEVLARGWGGDDSDSIIRLQEERAGVQLRLPE